ncbi:MAG TPA: hypothetical protein VEL81_02575 [Thermoplasmata archaeon]|nr:hypothetical protein [Thermoplasmata archaeon]
MIEIERTRSGDRIVRKIGVLHMKDTAPDASFRILEVTEGGMKVVRESTKPAAPLPSRGGGAVESQDERARRLHLIMQIASERLKLNPSDPDALFALAAAQATLDDAAGGVQTLDRLAALDPKYPGLWVLKTKLHARLGQTDLAKESRVRALEEEAEATLPAGPTVPCPMCEAPVAPGAATCENCGVRFAPARTLEDELDDLGHAAIQEMVQEELAAEPKPDVEPPPIPKPAEKAPSKPSPTKGMTNGLVLQRGAPRRTGRTNGLKGRTNGLRGRTKGLTNGLGRTNGLTNGVGRTNGLTNGLGRTNGLTNGLGRTNGLTNGLGRTNGLTNGLGRTNGITNGLGRTNGLTNGLGGVRPAGFHSSGVRGMMRNAGWKLYLIPLVSVALLLMPLFMVPEYQGPAYPIRIDGVFDDWASISKVDATGGPVSNPNVDVIRFGIVDNLGPFAFYVQVGGTALQGGGPSPGMMDTVWIFVDTDASDTTGYRIDGLGADRLIEISGSGGAVLSSVLWEFDSNRDVRDWNGWIKGTGTSAAASGSQIEAEAEWAVQGSGQTPVIASVRTQSWDRQMDTGDVPLSSTGGSLLVAGDPQVPDVIAGADVSLLRLTLTAYRQSVSFDSLRVQIIGTAPVGSVSSLRLIDGTGNPISLVTPSSRDVTFSFPGQTILAGTSAVFTVVGDFSTGNGETFGIHLSPSQPLGVGGAVVAARDLPGARTLGYIGGAPPTPRIDGGFDEWTAASADPTNDVSPASNPDIDLARYGSQSDNGTLYLYSDVTGRILTGTPVPRPPQAAPPPGTQPPADTDRDAVPDSVDPMPYDFNNDGVPDAQTSGDYDGDGFTDYGFPGGTDYWLNTTIPATFPPPYAGRVVSLYIGPTDRPPLLGEDVVRLFLDIDNSTWSGYAIGGIGADRLVEIRGKAGQVTQSALLSFAGSFPGQWSWSPVSPVTVAVGYHALELSLPLNATSLYVESGDFWGSTDSTTAAPALVRQLSSFNVAASTSPLSVPWVQVGPQPTTVIDPGSNAATTTYNHQRKVVRAGDVAGQTACDATNSDGCWYVVFYDQFAETTVNTAPSTETITKGSKVSGTFPTDIQTSNNAYIQYREANQAPVVDHTFVEQTTRQTTTSLPYVDITGASIASSSFTAGRKYLLVFTGQLDSASTTRNAYIQALHGTTAFSGSEFSVQTTDTASRYSYYWFTVWTAVSGEGVKLQFHTEQTGFIIGADQVTMFKLDLGDLTENTDWFFNENTVGDTIAGSTWDGLASVTFTPSAASNWLVMTTMRGDPDTTNIEYASRIARSGEAVETQPLTQWEGNDANNDRYVQTLGRVYTLTAASNTFTQESQCASTCTYPRSYSSVFALDLDKFEDRTSVWTEAPTNLGPTDFGTEVQTASMTPTRTADVWIVGQIAVDIDATGAYHKFRLQVDNADQPGTQTSDAYQQWTSFDTLDEVLSAIQTVENLGVSAHSFDLDASRSSTPGAAAEDRVIFAVSMVLADYEMEIRYDWSGIATGSSAYVLNVEAHHTAGEDFLVQVLTPPSTWNTRITITKTADDNAAQTYTLTTAEFNAGAPSIRFLGSAEAFDSSQSDLYLDYVIVSSISYWDRIILMRSSDTSGSTWGSQIILASGRTGDSALVLARDSSEASIAIDSAGFLHVVWVAASAPGDQSTLDRVRYTKTTVAYPTQSELASGANWEAVTNVDNPNPGYMPTVSTDTSNNPHVAWSGSKTSGTVYYKNHAGGTWRSTVSWGTTYTGLSVDVSPQNNYVSLARYYEAATNEIQYTVCKDLSTSNCDASGEFTKWDGTAGADTVATAVESGSYASLATTYETNGDLWVAYAKDVDGSTRAIYARFLDYPSTGWAASETVDSLSGTQFTRPTIGLDKDGGAYAFYVAISGPQLYFKSRLGGSWNSRTAIDTSTDYPSLMVRAPNNASYGTGVFGAVYWNSSNSQTYFMIPEFETVVPPMVGVILTALFVGRRAKGRAKSTAAS